MENADNEIWGRHRLQEALQNVYTRPMKLGLKSLIHSSRSWQVNGLFGDDVALVGLALNEGFQKGH